jgi:outer membrane immunogenic protein
MVRKLLMTTALVCLASGAALAADLPSEKGPPVYSPPPPPPPAFTWSGVYIGAQVGYGWGTSGAYDTTAPSPIGTYSTSGVVGGGHIGYNYQISQFVFGLEGDMNASTENGSTVDGVDIPGNVLTIHKNYDASIRGRIGYAFDRVLIYATGGGAYGDFRTSYSAPGAFDGDFNDGRFGWTVGGGIEYAIDNNWSVRAEYRYTDYGHINDLAINTYGDNISQHLRDNRVQVGFSYKFDMFAPPAPIVSKY